MSSGNRGMDGDLVGRLVLRRASRHLGERPAHDDKAARKQISAIVERQVGMNDRRMARRRQMLSGVPFPGSIMSRLEAWPTRLRAGSAEIRRRRMVWL
jgi:hypothetical protein